MTNYGVYYSDNGWSQAYDLEHISSSSYKTDAQMRALAQSNPLHHIWTGYKEFTYDPVANGLISKTNNIASCSVDSQIGTTWATSSSGGTSGNWYVNKAVRAYLNPSSEGTLYRIRLAPLYTKDLWGEISITYYIYVVAGVAISFDPNGGNFSYTNTIVNGITYGATTTTNAVKGVSYGSTYGVLPTPSRSGHTFSGWFTSASGGTQISSTSTVSISTAQTLYAQWETPHHNVYLTVPSTYSGASATATYNGTTYTVNSGQSRTMEVSPNSSVTFTATNISGYAFQHWHIFDINLEYEDFDPGIGTNHSFTLSNINNDYDVYPEYTPLYTVTIQSNNTSYGTVSPTSVTQVPSGSTITVSSNQLIINGTTVTATPKTDTAQYDYSFVNWTGLPSNNRVTSNVTITANFTRALQEYTVYFNPNGGRFTYMNTTIDGITYGSTTTSTAYKSVAYSSTYGTLPAPTRSGYTLDGWYSASTGGTKVTSSTTVALSANQTLHAHWALIPNYVYLSVPSQYSDASIRAVYTSSSGSTTHTVYSGSNETISAEPGSSIAITASNVQGLVFEQWHIFDISIEHEYLDPGSGSDHLFELNNITGDYNIYPEYKTAYTVTFVPNNASYGTVNNQSRVEVQDVPRGTTYSIRNNVFTVDTSPTTTVTATPNAGYIFDYWGTNMGQIIGNMIATAYFVQTQAIGTPESPMRQISTSLDNIYNGHYSDIYVFNGSSISITASGDGETYSIDIENVPAGYGLSKTLDGSVTGTLSATGDITITYAYTAVDEDEVYHTFVIHSIQGYMVTILRSGYGDIYRDGVLVSFGEEEDEFASYMLVAGSQFELEYESTSGGYQFASWRKYVQGLDPVDLYNNPQTFTVDREFTVEAIVSGTQLTITFDAATNGGTLVGVSSKTVTYGQTFGEDGVWPSATKSGYAFNGWYTEITGGALITASTLVYFTSDRTLYAQFGAQGEDDDPPNPDEQVDDVGDVSGGSTTDRRCYLAYYRTNSPTPTAVLELPNVQGIEETDTAQLTEISSVIYGYDDNFVMDIGTIQKYNITFERVQPMNEVNDSSDNFYYQDSWSNGHWFEMFKKFTERWQNLNYGVVNGVAVRTGGYRLHFEPGGERLRPGVSYSDLYPTIDKTVFMLGTANMQISPNNLQHIKVTLPVTVGSMVRQTIATPTHSVDYIVDQGQGGLYLSNTVNYPSNLPFPVASPPKEWFLQGALGLSEFKSWRSNAYIGTNNTWYPGQIVNDTANSVSTMTSYWEEPILAVMVTYSMTTDGIFVWDVSHPLPDVNYPSRTYALSEISSASTIRAWAVGGGGAGGSRSKTPYSNKSSGGGGSGGFDSIGVGFAYTDLASITFTVGLGGRIGSGVSGGVNGGTTSVLLNYSTYDSEVISVAGGRYPIINSSTSYSSDGGNGGSPGGTAGSSGIDGIGGAGASVPDLENGLQLGNFILTSIGGAGGAIRSDGGNGAGYGAGGGGGGAPLTDPYTSGGAGSPGVIILAFYE